MLADIIGRTVVLVTAIIKVARNVCDQLPQALYD